MECSPLKHTIQLVLRNAYQDSNSVAPSDTFCPFPGSPPEAITPGFLLLGLCVQPKVLIELILLWKTFEL